jgi:hypothetical protein
MTKVLFRSFIILVATPIILRHHEFKKAKVIPKINLLFDPSVLSSCPSDQVRIRMPIKQPIILTNSKDLIESFRIIEAKILVQKVFVF